MTIIKPKTFFALAALPLALSLSACETPNGGNNALKKGAIGAAAGAVAGAVIGNNAGDGDAQSGALIGAVIGGAGGAYAGCREDGGCGAQPKYQNGHYPYNYSQRQNAPSQSAPAQTAPINKRQYFDRNTGRYYYYDPVTRKEYYENGDRKYN